MPEIGVRELKAKAPEELKDLRDRKVRYTITYRGKPIGVLSPVPEESVSSSEEDPWEIFVRLGKEIANNRETERDSVDILSEMRR